MRSLGGIRCDHCWSPIVGAPTLVKDESGEYGDYHEQCALKQVGYWRHRLGAAEDILRIVAKGDRPDINDGDPTELAIDYFRHYKDVEA